MREAAPDYKRAIVAVAIAGGVGATLAGAGLLAYRIWRSRRTRDVKPSVPVVRTEDPERTVSYVGRSRRSARNWAK